MAGRLCVSLHFSLQDVSLQSSGKVLTSSKAVAARARSVRAEAVAASLHRANFFEVLGLVRQRLAPQQQQQHHFGRFGGDDDWDPLSDYNTKSEASEAGSFKDAGGGDLPPASTPLKRQSEELDELEEKKRKKSKGKEWLRPSEAGLFAAGEAYLAISSVRVDLSLDFVRS
jgi:hypothetical protein